MKKIIRNAILEKRKTSCNITGTEFGSMSRD